MARKKVTLAEPLGDFRLHPMPSYMQRFYLLYKTSHITDQDFKHRCRMVGHRPMENIEDFLESIIAWELDGYRHPMVRDELRKWVMEHWSHFNPNIQERIEVEYPVKDKRCKNGYRTITKLI